MRYNIVDDRREGQQRIVSKYLYLPRRIGDEVRWLERCGICQTLHRMFDVTSGSVWWEWRDDAWRDKV